MKRYRQDLKQKARALRSRMTDAEQVRWSKLRRKQIKGVQFYRQRPIENYIVDSYAPGASLIIEVDGSQHFACEGAIQYSRRDEHLTGLALCVLRFDNLQVLKETESVIAVIHHAVLTNVISGKIPPDPPLRKGGNHGQSDKSSLKRRGNRSQAASEKGGNHGQSIDAPLSRRIRIQAACEQHTRQFPPLKKGS